MCDRIADLLVSLQTRRQRVRASNTSTARQESTRFCDLSPCAAKTQSERWSAQKRVCAGFASRSLRASLWIYVATTRELHMSRRECSLQMVPRGSNTRDFFIQASLPHPVLRDSSCTPICIA